MSPVTLNTIEADGVKVFYRSAGASTSPVLLLLHGFPSSSHQFRQLIPLLAPKYRVIAPDLPGFGFTEVPATREYKYSFDNISRTIEAFTQALKITKFAVYAFDYGAPTAFRIALRHPERIAAIISQNGNAYEAGLGEDFWRPIREFWKLPGFQPNLPEAATVATFLTLETTKWQYTSGVPSQLLGRIAPESYTLDAALIARPGQLEIQGALLFNYGTNVEMYPQWQEYLRTSGVPVLAVWGENDPAFVKAGAEAYRNDVKDLVVHFVDSGHFALETHVDEIAKEIEKFLATRLR